MGAGQQAYRDDYSLELHPFSLFAALRGSAQWENYLRFSQVTPFGIADPLHSFSFTFFLKWGKNWSVFFRDFCWLILLGFLGTFINRIFWSWGLALTTASNSALTMSHSPIFVLLSSALLLRIEVTSRSALGIIIAFVGVSLVIKGDWHGLEVSSRTLQGDLLIISAAATWALFTVLAKRLLKEHSNLKVTAYIMIIGAFFSSSLCPMRNPVPCCRFLAAPGSMSCMWPLWEFPWHILCGFWASKKVEPLRTILYQYLSPFTAMLFAIPCLRRDFPSAFWMQKTKPAGQGRK
jgi:drug/metabolite transporter (DMT)-like permease